MKTGIMVIFLLGYGLLGPLSCAKKQSSSRETIRKQEMALFAPGIKIIRKPVA